jgi:hypothetical protein
MATGSGIQNDVKCCIRNCCVRRFSLSGSSTIGVAVQLWTGIEATKDAPARPMRRPQSDAAALQSVVNLDTCDRIRAAQIKRS